MALEEQISANEMPMQINESKLIAGELGRSVERSDAEERKYKN